jgi:hypothetical protein
MDVINPVTGRIDLSQTKGFHYYSSPTWVGGAKQPGPRGNFFTRHVTHNSPYIRSTSEGSMHLTSAMDSFLDQATTTLQYGYPHYIPKLYRQQKDAQQQYFEEKQRQLRRARESRILNNYPPHMHGTFRDTDQFRYGHGSQMPQLLDGSGWMPPAPAPGLRGSASMGDLPSARSAGLPSARGSDVMMKTSPSEAALK